jgi:hypothetical protein
LRGAKCWKRNLQNGGPSGINAANPNYGLLRTPAQSIVECNRRFEAASRLFDEIAAALAASIVAAVHWL